MEHGKSIFCKIVSRNRFQDILRVLQFDDAAAQRSCRSRDKFSPIRNVFEIWNKSLLDAFVPGPNLTVDEQLVTFRGRCLFRQYMPSKSGKYGIKIWVICDSTSHYVLKMDVYKGREIGEPRETSLGSKLVLKLSEPFKKSERNITCDNFFTNLKLGKKLLMQNLTVVGAIRKNRNRTDLPAEFVSTKDRKESTTLYGYQKEAKIVSYCPKKGKAVTLLSTMHSDKGTESPAPEKKPEVITYYNARKGGVDTMDQMVRWFTSKRKTRRWPMIIFYNMLDISALNALIIWMSLNKENHAGKRGNRLRWSLLICLAKELAGLQDKDTIQIQASSSENIRKRKRCSM